MNIKINGKEESIEAKNILELIIKKQFNPEVIVIEHNKEIIKEEEWKNCTIKEDDDIEIISFVGGG